jgi:hypothetical protein
MLYEESVSLDERVNANSSIHKYALFDVGLSGGLQEEVIARGRHAWLTTAQIALSL